MVALTLSRFMSELKDELNQPPALIIGIGASAGGLEAIERFFGQDTPSDRCAYIVIQHLSPDFKSMMAEILGRLTTLKILEAEDGMPLESGTIYLNRPRTALSISNHRINILPINISEKSYRPIDQTFSSIASQYQSNSIGIILSGTGSDGEFGGRAISENGGLLLTQSLETALFGSMPQSATDAVPASISLSPEEMPEVIQAYLGDPNRDAEQFLMNSIDYLPLLNDNNALSFLLSLFQKKYEVDFSLYKPQTLIRRLERRMSLDRFDDFQAYIKYLQNNPNAMDQIYRELLIDVTRFYRDPEGFKWLRDKAIPDVLDTKNEGETVRAWVAACSSGEEAYSIAILLLESIEKANKFVDLRIFATDLHPESIAVASAGRYSSEKLENLPFHLRSKYFARDGASFRVSKALRQKIVFSVHDLLSDPPFNEQDLITCRNMLIYVRPKAQAMILDRFANALQHQGILFLGPSEHLVGNAINYFTPLSRHWRIYKKSKLATSISTTTPPYRTRRIKLPPHLDEATDPLHIQQGWEVDLLRRLIPAGFICDSSGKLREIYGKGKEYIQFAVGAVNLNLPDLLNGNLAIAVRNGLLQGSRSKEEVRFSNIQVEVNQTTRIVDLRIIPFPQHVIDRDESSDGPLLYLIAIDERKEVSTLVPVDVNKISAEEFSEIQSLKLELAFTRESLQSALEELEASNEEMQSANEELTAANEELQSTNEELSSVNEELYSVNTEYQEQNHTLNQLINDNENLQRASGVLIIFLDESLRIRQVTPACYQMFNLIESDIGRPITQFTPFTSDQGISELIRLAQDALNGIPSQTEVKILDQTPLRMQVIPYQGDYASISGVVLYFTDLSDIRAAEAELRLAEARYRSVVEMQEEMICRWGVDDMVITFANKAYQSYQEEDPVGKSLKAILSPIYLNQLTRNVAHIKVSGETHTSEEVVEKPDGSRRYIVWRDTPIRNNQGEIIEIQGVGRDVTEIRLAQHELSVLNARYESVIENQSDLIIRFDPQTHILSFANEAFARFHGLEQNVLIGTSSLIGFSPEKHAAIMERNEQIMQREYGPNQVIEMTNHMGETRHVTWRVQPVVDENGHVNEIQGVGTDVTDLIETQKSLDQANRQISSVNNHLPIWISQINKTLTLQYANQHYIDTFNLPQESIVGLHVRDVLGESLFQHDRKYYERALKGEKVSYTARLNINGRQTTASRQLIPEIKGGEIIGIFAFGYDITSISQQISDLKSSYEQLDVINSSLPIWIAVIDREHNFVYANDYHRILFGRSAEEMVGMHAQNLIGDKGYQALKERYDAALLGEEFRYGDKMTLPNGQRIDIRVRMGPIVSTVAGQQANHLYVTVVNLTALEQNEL